MAADLDGDGKVEIVIDSMAADPVGPIATGILKWQGSALGPTWMKHGPIDGWQRTPNDRFIAADVDGDRKAELLIYNNSDGWIGVLKWDGSALRAIWGSPSPISGPAGNWQRNKNDVFVAADVDGDGRAEVFVYGEDTNWKGILGWNGSAMRLLWMAPPPIAAGWPTGYVTLQIQSGDVDGDGKVEIVWDYSTLMTLGWMKWNGTAIETVGTEKIDPLGPRYDSSIGRSLHVADIDGDGRAEVALFGLSRYGYPQPLWGLTTKV